MAKQRKKGLSNAVKHGSAKEPGILRNLSCEELARRSQRGCRASFAVLVERYGFPLFRFLRYKTDSHQDTEDLVQDTFLKAYENIHRYKDSWKFSTWLFTIAARLAYSRFRSSRSFQTVDDFELNDPEPVQMLVEKETQKKLWALARNLSVNQYHALWLKYQQGMSVKEIAMVLRKSQVNVKVLLYRARINLAKRLQKVSVENDLEVKTSPEEILAFMKVEGA